MAEELADPPRGGVGAGEQVARQRFDLVLNPSSARSVAVTGEAADGSPAGTVREPYLGLDDWGAGEHSYRSRPSVPPPSALADAGDGPWTIEFVIEVTTLDA